MKKSKRIEKELKKQIQDEKDRLQDFINRESWLAISTQQAFLFGYLAALTIVEDVCDGKNV